jgi:NitT/TauT family transport system ATP-binding protein
LRRRIWTRDQSRAPITSPGRTAVANGGTTVTSGLNVSIGEVSKWYPTAEEPVHALDRISLEMAQGEFISILGPSGCGKSTLMLMLAGLIPYAHGDIRIGTTRIAKPYTDLGIVFQSPVLLDWLDVVDNIMLQAKMRGLSNQQYRSRAMELIELVGLNGFENKRPYELSGGMRQRVAICRALLHGPPIILMDEPFGALDALTRDQLNLDLLDIWRRTGALVVFVTHSISEAVFLADRVVVMSPRPGKVETILDVDLPRPRHLAIRETSEFGAIAQEIRDIFGKLGILRDEVKGDASMTPGSGA